MGVLVLQTLNIFFLVFHTGLVVFNVFGWAHPRMRRLNLVTLSLTLFSWTVMGAWHGVGYCICTDWHWQIRHALGYRDTANSYVQFLVQTLTPLRLPDETVSNLCAWVFVLSFVMSIGLNLRDARRDHLLPFAR